MLRKHEDFSDTYITPQAKFHVRKLSAHVGACVSNISISKISPHEFEDIHAAWLAHGVLVISDQDISVEDLVEFTKRFGALVPHVVSEFNSKDYPDVTILSNIQREDGTGIGADRSGMQWHTDGSFRECPPKASLLHGIECPPEGANTEFCSTRAAFDELPIGEKKFLSGLQGVHDYCWYWRNFQPHRPPLSDDVRKSTPPMIHPALRTHPETRWNSIYVMSCMTRTFVGMEEEEARKIIDDLTDFSSQKKFCYSHSWREKDLVIWDNRATMHRATEFNNKYRRLMHRTSVRGDRPFFVGL